MVIPTVLDSRNLEKVIHSGTKCIFVNMFNKSEDPPQALVGAIQKCVFSLQCISLNESVISNKMLQALASCPSLAGILLEQLHLTANDDGCWLQFCARPKLLTWLYGNDNVFGTA